MSGVPPPNPPSPAHPPALSVGTLTYTRPQLFKVFFWLLWGDFVLTLMDNGVVASVVPLQLAAMGASTETIGFLSGTVMALLSVLLVSVISTASDRHRGRLGRRMPFMLYSTPPLAICLIGVGFSRQIADALHTVAPGVAATFGSIAMSLLPGTATVPAAMHTALAVMTVTLILYKIFDTFPQSVYYYVWPDVLPHKLIGTFACLFRIVGALGSFVFHRYMLKWAETHPEWLYIVAGGLYFVSFTAMCLIVKEGQYPPPPERPAHVNSYWRRTTAWLRESYSLPFYVKFFLMSAAFIIAVKSLNQFAILFGTRTMNLTAERYGQLVSYKDLVVIVPFLILGPLVDRYHPLRAGLFAFVLVIASGVSSFFFIQGELSFAICMTATFVSIAIYQAATGAINARILPREQFGQFAAAGAIVFNLGWAFSAWLCGMFLDWMKDDRYLFLWFAGFAMAGLTLMVMVYRDWKKMGGDDGYVPPLPDRRQPADVEAA